MPATEAQVGYGSTVEVSTDGGSNWTQFSEVYGLTPPAPTKSNPLATHMQSPSGVAERVDGKILDYGQTTFNLNWIPGSAADVLVNTLAGGGLFKIRETFPNGVTWTLSGLFASKTPTVPLDDKMTCAVTVDTSGPISLGSASAPTNTVLPAISGTLAEGDVLTAYEGVWTGAPTFTYQWKNAGVNISMATNRTYTLVAGDSGDDITVTVTGTNTAGSASATSAPVTAD